MTLYQVAFRDEIAVSVVVEFMKRFYTRIDRFNVGEYGLTFLVNLDQTELMEYDWAFSMICDMEQ